MIEHFNGASWERTWFRSLVSVKRWATRHGHVWRMHEGLVVVSTHDGTVHRYREVKEGGTR